MERVQRIVGLVLVVGLLAAAGLAFAVAQNLKSEVPFISTADFSRATPFSPDCGCVTARARFSVTISRSGAAEVWVATRSGRRVRTLLQRTVAAGVVALEWDGRTTDGAPADDGEYRIRARVGGTHSLTFPQSIRLDRTPPTVRSGYPAATTIAAGAPYSFVLTSNEDGTAQAAVYTIGTDGTVARLWRSATPVRVTHGADARLTWPGLASDTRPTTGTVIVGWSVTDGAGNTRTVPERFTPDGLGGAAVLRDGAVRLGSDGRVVGDGPVRLALHRLVDSLPGTLVSETSGPAASTSAPAAPGAGLYGLEAIGTDTRAWGAVAVPGRATVLVVVPTYTWQAANGYDGDGDGFPDVTPHSQGLSRPLDDDGRRVLDALVATAGPVLRSARGFGAIGDADLEDRGVPRRARVLVLAGMGVWTRGLVERIRAFERGGGRVVRLDSPLGRVAERREAAIVLSLQATQADLGTAVIRSARRAARLVERITRRRGAHAR